MCPLSSSIKGGGSSSVYSLNCSVCEAKFSSKQKWEQHLTQEGHQNLTRSQEEASNYRSKNDLRECSLVIFTAYDLTVECSDKIIKYFSKDKSTLVTDFVWWEDRPRIGIVQFESRKIVEAIVKDVRTNSVQIDYQDVQVKSAVDMLDLEWKAILPGYQPFSLINPTQMTERSIDTAKSHIEPIELIDTKVATEVVVVTENPSNYLYPQLQDVRNAIKISDKKSKRDHEIISVIKNILQDRIPSSKAISFRNWYLNMKNFTTSITDDPLLVYVYSLDESSTQCNSTFVSGSFIKRYLTGEKFTCLSSKKTHLGMKFIYKPSKSFVYVVNSKQAMAEVQLSQLAKYYFDFDTRVRPIFYLAQYWKITNGIQFGQLDVPAEIYRKCLPEPYCLYWILITFLIHENILPSVRTILGRDHTSQL